MVQQWQHLRYRKRAQIVMPVTRPNGKGHKRRQVARRRRCLRQTGESRGID